jgi:hypothetical protein
MMLARATLLKITAALAIVGLAVGPVAPGTRGLLVDQASSTGSFTTDTLNPPTGLGAVGGINAQLSWTITPDTYATGYDVLRSTTSGGGFGVVATVTPRSATTYADAPPVDGTYYYVLRSEISNWTSVRTSEVVALVQMGLTIFTPCTAQAADLGGDLNGYEGTAANACATDGALATDTDSGTTVNTGCGNIGKDTHRFSSFGITLPATVTSIDGIRVRIRAAADSIAVTTKICAQLSWNNGLTWSNTQQDLLTSTAITAYTLGGAANLWGHTPWTVGELSNANFIVKLTNVSSDVTRDFSLDSVEVRVNYSP